MRIKNLEEEKKRSNAKKKIRNPGNFARVTKFHRAVKFRRAANLVAPVDFFFWYYFYIFQICPFVIVIFF